MIDTSKKYLLANQQTTNSIFQWPQIFPITVTTYKSQGSNYTEEIRNGHTIFNDSTAHIMIRNSLETKIN